MFSESYKHKLYTQGKGIPLQAWTIPLGSRKLRLPEFLDSRYMKEARLSALHTYRLQGLKGHSAAGRITCMSIQNPNDPIESRARDFPACSAVQSNYI
jgi:hypothetical protein